ncbi:solute carrier family 23 member 2-like [Glandiceps talaboti]
MELEPVAYRLDMNNKALDIDLNEIKDLDENLTTVVNTDEEKDFQDQVRKLELKYAVDDIPPWYECFSFGFQQCVMLMSTNLVKPFLLIDILCVPEEERGILFGHLFSAITFAGAVGTFLQCTFGTRLPIIQGNAFTYYIPALLIMNLPQWKCALTEPSSVNGTINASNSDVTTSDRMREIQGAVVIAGLFQTLLGLSGLFGLLLRFIGPLTIAPTVCLLGLTISLSALNDVSKHWGIAFMTVCLVLIFSQYLDKVNVPYPTFSKGTGCTRGYSRLFALYSILFAICISWFFCWILTLTNVFTDDKTDPSYQARTDRNSKSVAGIPWVWFPVPLRWGSPTFGVAAIVGMCCGVLVSTIESIGDYYAAAKLSGVPPPPSHAVNRGISTEGIAGIIAGVWGSLGLTSYSANIGAMAITRVSSRRVFQYVSLIALSFALFGKIAAIMSTVPAPVMGGILLVNSGLMFAVGAANLQYVNMNMPRNLSIFGFAIVTGLIIPEYFMANDDIIDTGVLEIDQVFSVLLTTRMFVAGFTGFILDNTIPGTREQRGMIAWNPQSQHGKDNSQESLTSYDLPFCMSYIKRWRWTRYLPLCPTFGTKRGIEN